MTLLDLIRLKAIRSHKESERMAGRLVESWHQNKLSGELHKVLGLNKREYQAWTTGGVSLLTIAKWQQTAYPKLNTRKPWFKLSGTPGHERVGYLGDKATAPRKAARKKKRTASSSRAVSAVSNVG